MVADVSTTYVGSALTEAQARYAELNSRSREANEAARQSLPGGNTRTPLYATPFPLTFKSGAGATLTSLDGDTYLDFLGDYSAGIFGHRDDRLVKAITDALQNGWNLGGHNMYEKELAAKVTSRFGPSGLELVRFTNSGTEANTLNCATALTFTGRKKILTFSAAFHGSTFMFPIDLMRKTTEIPTNLPHEFVIAPFNNIPATKAILDDLPKDSLAAIIVEPIQGSGGCRPASVEFLHFLRNIADQQRALLIVDEVMASRLSPNGYCASIGLRADLLSLGKYVGGGMTFGAFGGRREIMELYDPSKSRLQHGGTFNNNVVTMAAGIEGLKIYNASKVDRLNASGVGLKKTLQQILIDEGVYRHHPDGASRNLIEVDFMTGPSKVLPDDTSLPPSENLPRMFVSGLGSMLNVRFSGSQALLWQALFYHHMVQRHIYLAQRGYLPLNLELKDADLARFVECFKEFVLKHKQELLSSGS
ncbi:hypothetical protein B0A52_03034 [Exophiala mesophila]|uniref:Glutamate-1-semialdehyde 2,1-aminomutase n=1 Tax=Exophiala mesophila TaxID=212818 RepID=A0A438NC86_EXOME|nr:hypothetical protein B0A52_03034 [Exophiala mesophila]